MTANVICSHGIATRSWHKPNFTIMKTMSTNERIANEMAKIAKIGFLAREINAAAESIGVTVDEMMPMVLGYAKAQRESAARLTAKRNAKSK